MVRNRTSRWQVALAGAAAATVVMTGCAAPTTGAAAGGLADLEPIVLTTSDINVEQSVVADSTRAFTEAIETATDGRVTFESYFSAALLPGNDILSGIGSGVADVGNLPVGYNPQELPASNWLLKMGAIPSASYPHGLIAGSAAVWETYASSEALRSEYEANNLHLLGAASSNRFSMLCTDPVDSVESLRGRTVRIGSAQVAPEVEGLGMAPVTMPIGEMYEALQRGVIDCAITVPNLNVEFGLWEVAREYLPAAFTAFPGAVLTMNLDRWNSLPPDVQTIFEDATYDWWQAYVGGFLGADAEFALTGPTEHGVTFHDPASVDAALAVIHEEQLAALPGSAPASVPDPAAFIQEFRDRNNDWLGVMTGDLSFPLQAPGVAGTAAAFEQAGAFDMDAFVEIMRERNVGTGGGTG